MERIVATVWSEPMYWVNKKLLDKEGACEET
jgi:hypothetical protein